MSMAASVEARVPFPDYRIADFANYPKSKHKARGWDTKQEAKRVAAQYLPDEVDHRRMSGFGVPLASYFRDGSALGLNAERIFNESDFRGLLDKNALLQPLSEHRSGTSDHSELLWRALNSLIWKEFHSL